MGALKFNVVLPSRGDGDVVCLIQNTQVRAGFLYGGLKKNDDILQEEETLQLVPSVSGILHPQKTPTRRSP